jgi:hypothetical protein
MLTEEDVRMFANALEPNSSAALLLFENTWATHFRDTLANASAEVLVFERIPRAVIDEMAGEEAATAR